VDQKQREGLIAEIAALIGDQREAIVIDIRAAIVNHISSKSSSECLSLVQRTSYGGIIDTLPLAAEKRYASALIAFVRKKPFEGFALDSALTDSTAEVVADAFSRRIGAKADAIAEKLLPLLVSDTRFVSGLSAAIISAYSGPVPRILQKKVVAVLTTKLGTVLSQTIDTTTTATIKASLIKLTATSISSPIAIKVASSIVGSLMTTLKPIIIKLLTSTAFKAAIVTKLKSIIVGSMLGAFIKIVGVKLGLTTAGSVMWILIPLVIAWIIYEISHFPDKLAAKVADSVAEDLLGNFADTTRSLSETLVERLLIEGTGLLASHIIQDESIVNIIEESVRESQ